MSDYKSTLPYFVCQENFGQCIANHPDDAEGQKVCKEEQKKCGTKDPDSGSEDSEGSDEKESSSSASAGPSPTKKTEASSTQAHATTGGNTAVATSEAASAALGMTERYSLGLMAASFVAALRFFVL